MPRWPSALPPSWWRASAARASAEQPTAYQGQPPGGGEQPFDFRVTSAHTPAPQLGEQHPEDRRHRRQDKGDSYLQHEVPAYPREVGGHGVDRDDGRGFLQFLGDSCFSIGHRLGVYLLRERHVTL